MSDLINRHNIVQFFYDSLSDLKISDQSTDSCMVYTIEDIIKIERYVKENRFVFYMHLHGFATEDEFDVQSHVYNPATGVIHKVETEIIGLAKVMEYHNGKLDMVSAAENDNWITYIKKQVSFRQPNSWQWEPKLVKEFETKLNLSFKKLPLSEEAHFQQITIDPLVLELDYCLMVDDIINFLNGTGSIVQVNPNLKVHLLFNGKFRRDA
ncbi:hypothetical protein GAP32_468 [Cronobacter phage vB_CsaM_GAP32]|uniref:Uncharacterized protein n=1 Tax=Cronobacter phage vB_CsaM_GAP32 TaxID=1141136 RepID=K4F6M8_9CAUD|nr:hypothetical protein GAP32_468 [Cronobacter phage vB_CsaM_GAP32]AFC21926.1 hypothetical protein GAP32_468 [Cronobacter phage vB_CsaM_GAP32]